MSRRPPALPRIAPGPNGTRIIRDGANITIEFAIEVDGRVAAANRALEAEHHEWRVVEYTIDADGVEWVLLRRPRPPAMRREALRGVGNRS